MFNFLLKGADQSPAAAEEAATASAAATSATDGPSALSPDEVINSIKTYYLNALRPSTAL